MSTVTIPSLRPRRRRDAHRRQTSPSAVRRGGDAGIACEPVSPLNPLHHGGRVVFEVRFRSSMNGLGLELLRRQLAMTSHVEHKLPVDPNSPAHAQLDQSTSLLLEHGQDDDDWVLQARTWGEPSACTVHGWEVCVTQVAHQLDPGVAIPGRIPGEPSDTPQHPVGRAANRRTAAVRRRLAGLP